MFIFFRVKENEPKENAHKTRPCGLPCASRKRRAQRNSLSLKQALSSLRSMLLRRTGASSPFPAMLGVS
jgi:hypothetical protein